MKNLDVSTSKESISIWGPVKHFNNMLTFYGEEILVPSPSPKLDYPPLAGYLQLLNQYILSYSTICADHFLPSAA
jgi:hypothetical protein